MKFVKYFSTASIRRVFEDSDTEKAHEEALKFCDWLMDNDEVLGLSGAPDCFKAAGMGLVLFNLQCTEEEAAHIQHLKPLREADYPSDEEEKFAEAIFNYRKAYLHGA